MLFLLLVACGSAPLDARTTTPDRSAALREVVAPVLAQNSHRAIGIVVVDGGREHVLAFGPRNANARFETDTSFEIGSISKVFTGLLLANAVRSGEVRLEDPVAQHLPPELVVAHGDRIALVDLAAHSAGFPLMPSNWTGLDPETARTTYTPELFRAYLATFEPLHPIGEGHSYSNVDTALLAAALSHRSGLSFRDLLARRLLVPLGMAASDYRDRPLASENVLDGYDDRDALTPKRVDASPIGPCCAISTTLSDMARFVGGALDPSHPLAADFALAAQVHRRGRATVGLGWDVDERLGLLRKNGQVSGYRSELILDPSHRRGLFVVVNSEAVDIDSLAFDLADALFDPLPRGAREAHAASVVERVPEGATAAHAAFGDAITLEAWEAPATFRPGDRLEIVFYWRASAPIAHDWKVFVHGDADRGPRLHADHFPAGSTTRVWQPGTIVRDAFAIEVPADYGESSFAIFTGLYRFGTRMPARQNEVPIDDARAVGPTISLAR
jgi:CubicO group peptidase (beta-lactamase class C family)